jgi:hypothetical protein
MDYRLDTVKLELERIYKEYCNVELDNQESDRWIPMLKEFVNFSLNWSENLTDFKRNNLLKTRDLE